MQKEKVISVIVPVYKVEKYLGKCMDSILAQTYKNLEIILVDDGSPDRCPILCDEYAQKDKRIKVVHKKNGGVSSARNVGLDIASGDLIAFVDSDDYVQCDMYQKLLEKIDNAGSDVVIGGYNIVRNGVVKKCIETSLEDFVETKSYDYLLNYSDCPERKDDYIKNKHIPCYLVRMLFKKSVINNIRFFEDVGIMEDTLFFLNVLDKNKDLKISTINECLYNYLMRENSAMSVRPQMVENSISFVNHLVELVKEEELIKHIKYFLYFDCNRVMLRSKGKVDLSPLREWDTKENYKACKKHTFGRKERLKLFLIRHRLFCIYKMLAKRYAK